MAQKHKAARLCIQFNVQMRGVVVLMEISILGMAFIHAFSTIMYMLYILETPLRNLECVFIVR